MALSRGQFTNVISKGKKMGYKNPTGPQKFKKKELYPVSNKDIAFLKKNMPKTKKKKSKNPHKD